MPTFVTESTAQTVNLTLSLTLTLFCANPNPSYVSQLEAQVLTVSGGKGLDLRPGKDQMKVHLESHIGHYSSTGVESA